VNEALQQSIYPLDAFITVLLHGYGLTSCARPVNLGEIAKALARIRELWGEGIGWLQQSMKLGEDVGVAELRRTRMITGDSDISGRWTHSAINSPKVRLSRKPPRCAEPASARAANALAAVEMRRIQVTGSQTPHM